MTFALVFAMTAAISFAQSSGSLSGTVTDTTGAIVQGATVTVKNVATNAERTVVTNEDGRWTIPVLSVGTYSVSYQKEGFQKSVNENIEVEASVPRTIDVTLTVGGTENVVTITDTTPLITPETSTTARQITGEEITRVPTSTRSFTQLTTAEAGVSAELSPVATNSNGNISPSVNGTRTTATSLYFNGIDATNITSNEGSLTDNIAPAPETLQEVKLQTSLYDASTGRSGGGNFQLVTRQGGNRFSGQAYYYGQNKRLTANEFFLKREEIEKPDATRNEYGFNFQGPIVREKFFFFGNYQRTNARTGFVPTARSTTVLPAALGLITGERTAANIAAAFNQRNGCTVGVNCLTAADIAPVALRLLNLRNPVTGDYVIATPRANATPIGVDRAGARAFLFGTVATGGVTSRTLQENNQLVTQTNVEPSEFEQNQATIRLDGNLTDKDIISGTFFYSKFPGFDSFPDPSSLASPFTLLRNDQNRTLSTAYTRLIGSNATNELRFGYFFLNNTRRLDDPFLTDEFLSENIGIVNPATQFDTSIATRRLGHFVGRNALSRFSFGGPNDSFNRREQTTYSLSDNFTYVTGNHTFKFGGEYRKYKFDTNLPEEQATEFEKYDSFTQFITGNATEADTQFGVTDKSFRFSDYAGYITDDWKITPRLTLNLGVRYEFFGLPTEKDGRIGNFDFSSFEPCFQTTGGTAALCDNPTRGFIVPKNVQNTGLGNVDASIAVTKMADNNHTLNGQDKNNFAPRIGAAYKVNDRLVVRGGYGLFYDRPSGAFINTVFSNYPFLREVEITVPNGNVPIANAFNTNPTNLPLAQFLPFRIVRSSGTGGSYTIRDNTGVTTDPRGTSTGSQPGNIAETFEFRAIDRNLSTPYIHQFNLGVQYEIVRDLLFEARYVGTRGRNLLQAVAFNQGYDLNDANAPEQIYERFNQAYLASGAPNGPLNAGATARERGIGRAFGFANPYRAGLTPGCSGGVLTLPGGTPIDLNLANPITCTGSTIGGGSVLGFEARVPILGFNVPEAVLLTNGAESEYNSAQFILSKRFSNNLQFNVAYTFSKSIDTSSSDPGSTAGGGRPDVPNAGFVVQGDQRQLESNRALSDFDRTHRFSTSFTYEIPTGGSNNQFLSGFQVSGFFQAQSGTPFTVFSPEPEIASAAQYTDLVRGSGGLIRTGFGRPNFVCSSLADAVGSYNSNSVGDSFINRSCFTSALGNSGNLGRNTFRGPSQRRFDIGLAKRTRINERFSFDLGIDIFNLFNTVNLTIPEADLSDVNNFGRISNTTGGPRLAQFRARFIF